MNLPKSYLEKVKTIPELSGNLPNLDELIQLVKSLPQYKETSDYALLSKMRCNIAQCACDKYLRTQSMYDFWLIFYMNVKYRKEWNDGAKKWI